MIPDDQSTISKTARARLSKHHPQRNIEHKIMKMYKKAKINKGAFVLDKLARKIVAYKLKFPEALYRKKSRSEFVEWMKRESLRGNTLPIASGLIRHLKRASNNKERVSKLMKTTVASSAVQRILLENNGKLTSGTRSGKSF